MEREFIAQNTADIPWQDAGPLQELPPGPEVKILRHKPDDDNAQDVLVRFPPGYVEPRHTHKGEHMVLIVEGTMIVDGKTLGPGDYVYGPRNEPHGPFEFPDGAIIYAAHRGDLAHEYEGKEKRNGGPADEPDLDAPAPHFLAVRSADIPWQSAVPIVELPEGVEAKVLRHDPDDDEALDMLVRFPAGYTEPRHTHPGEHNNIILEGRMLIDGKTLSTGDYVFGPRVEPHGPFGYPDGIVLCAFHRADPAHEYEGKTYDKETAA